MPVRVFYEFNGVWWVWGDGCMVLWLFVEGGG